jgi:hypothetical protein
MVKDLDAMPETSFYAHQLKEKIESMLSLWMSTLDPMKYRKSYVKKVNLDGPPIPGYGNATMNTIAF